MISFISALEIINIIDPNIFLWIAASVVAAAVVNTEVKTVLACGLSFH